MKELLQILSKQTKQEPDALRSMYIDLKKAAPVLLNNAFPKNDLNTVILTPPTGVCPVSDCKHLQGDIKGLLMDLHHHNTMAKVFYYTLSVK